MAKEEEVQEIKNCIVDCMSLIDTEDVEGCIDKMLNLCHKLKGVDKKGGIEMLNIDWEKCINLANKRLRDVITAANKADPCEMEALMMSSMCGATAEFTVPTDTKQAELTLNGDQTKGIYFMFNCYKFHITKDTEFNAIYTTNMYHLWCLCDYFKNVEDPVKHVHVTWLFGAAFLEEKHKAFLTGKITQQEFEQYLWDKVHTCCSDWLEKNIEKINK